MGGFRGAVNKRRGSLLVRKRKESPTDQGNQGRVFWGGGGGGGVHDEDEEAS